MAVGDVWTRDEDRALALGIAAGESDRTIHETRLPGRSTKSVSARRERLGWPGGKMIREGKAAPPATQAPPAAPASAPEVATRLEREAAGDTEYLHCRSARVRTLADLLAYAEVDESVWEVERYTVNQWEMGARDEAGQIVTQPLYQIKAWLKRSRSACLLRAIGDEIVAGLEQRRPDWRPAAAAVLPRLRDRHLFEVCVMDLHVGKLAWSDEAGEDYDISIAETVFREALETLVQGIQGRCVEQVLFPIGNDLLQIDNIARTTTGGTPQDTDTRYAKMYARAEGLMRYALERLSDIAPVVAPIVPGNHDRQSALSLGRTLRAWFHGNDRVSVDASPRLRKYHRYGVNLLGYTHGSEEKPADLPLIMAQECPHDWAETRFREWHVGHLHKAKETRYTAGDTYNGVRVRIIPALCPADAWHYQKGYVGGVRSAEAYLWNRETGYAGHVAANVLPPLKEAA